MNLKCLHDKKKIYFIGVGGVSMSALAKLLCVCGYQVSGSDAVKGEETENLLFYGVKVYIGVNENRLELLEADVVIYTDAISAENAELQKAKRMEKRIYSRAEFLGVLCREFSFITAIAGSHGKTTCTSMCAHVLKSVGVPFTAHIGGLDYAFGNFYSSGFEHFLTEACEYKKNLLTIAADKAVVLNIDRDHMECYQDESELVDCFRQYCEQAKSAFICADDEKC